MAGIRNRTPNDNPAAIDQGIWAESDRVVVAPSGIG